MTTHNRKQISRRNFIAVAVGGLSLTAAAGYAASDRKNLRRSDFPPEVVDLKTLQQDEREILLLASLAPSGHNTQPWLVTQIAPYHWIIGNDERGWLPAVDPDQRETLLSLGAFLQNLDEAAGSFGYACRWTLLATSNQDKRVMEVRLIKGGPPYSANVAAMKNRRTMRGAFLREAIRKEDLGYLVAGEPELIHYLPTGSKHAGIINELTVEANRLQAYRDPAQQELAEWIRFRSDDARKHRDGLTPGSMEINGLAGWAVRNFFNKASVQKMDFRERTIAQVHSEVVASAGWLLITSKEVSVAALLDAGRRMQRLFLKVQAMGIALHPMTQILEEPSTRLALPTSVGITDAVQFILRVGYVADYKPPVSLRRPVGWFLRKEEL